MRNTRIIITFIIAVMTMAACVNDPSTNEQSIINLDHLKHLYASITLPNGHPGGIVHIYSEYPDYAYAVEPEEGYACVDDVARALVLLSALPDHDIDPGIMQMMECMTEFVLSMQAENGYFYNFIWEDLSINKTYRTSRAEPDWWSWRALWCLAEVYPHLKGNLALKAREAANKLASVVKDDYLDKPREIIQLNGLDLPAWLPMETAFDQAALLTVAMISYHENIYQDTAILQLAGKFCEGLMLTQAGDSLHFPHYAYLSWNNLWHAYGNIQSYAMLKAGKLLGRDDFIASALKEVDFFYSYLIGNGFLHHFYVECLNDTCIITETQLYPQIAYGIRPLVFACLEAYDITGDLKYIALAEDAASWLAGKNTPRKMIYDPANGRCFDGIVSENEINLNSGAESTIEALLTLQAISNHPVAEINHIYKLNE